MASKKFLHDLDLNLNQLLNSKFQVLAADPTPTEAQFWYNSTDSRVKYYDGTTIQEVANLNDIVGLLNYKGGYDASGNTPNLDSAPTAGTIEKGDVYTVTVAGQFYTEDVQIGDMLIAEIDDPASLGDWTVVEQNLNYATETVAGYIEIATQVETDTGLDDTRAITPLKLKTYLSNLNYVQKFAVDLDNAESAVVRVQGGGQTTFTVTHSLNKTDVQVQVREIATGREDEFEILETGANTIDVKGNGNVADGVYRVIIQA